jgi:hypothetical protein
VGYRLQFAFCPTPISFPLLTRGPSGSSRRLSTPWYEYGTRSTGIYKNGPYSLQFQQGPVRNPQGVKFVSFGFLGQGFGTVCTEGLYSRIMPRIPAYCLIHIKIKTVVVMRRVWSPMPISGLFSTKSIHSFLMSRVGWLWLALGSHFVGSSFLPPVVYHE